MVDISKQASLVSRKTIVYSLTRLMSRIPRQATVPAMVASASERTVRRLSNAEEVQRPPLRSERVPYEIWLQIIECSSLEHQDIAHLSLVSKFLRFVAQPMLFSEFRVMLHRARYLDVASAIKCQHVSIFARLKERLEFASLPRVVQSVKRLSIRIGNERRDWDRDAIVAEEEVVETVFNHLHHFVNLRSLSAQDVSLTGSHFDALAQLKFFNGIHLERCRCTGELGLARFKLRHLSLHGRMTGTYGWWIPLVRCPTVEHLSYEVSNIPGSADDPEVLFPALATGPSMRSLRTLRLPSVAASLPCFQSALSRCPEVENLYVEENEYFRHHPFLHGHPAYPPLARGTLPKLKAISAPSSFLDGCILQKDHQLPFRHISITNPLYGGEATFILDVIKLKCPELEEFVVRLADLRDTTWLNSVLTDLPGLRGLHVVVLHYFISFKHVSGLLQCTHRC